MSAQGTEPRIDRQQNHPLTVVPLRTLEQRESLVCVPESRVDAGGEIRL